MPITKKLDRILTILRSTMPFLYSDFSRSSRCMKSNSRLANRKQKKQASAKIDTEFVMMPSTIIGRMIATCSVTKFPYSEWNSRIVFWVGVSSAKN